MYFPFTEICENYYENFVNRNKLVINEIVTFFLFFRIKCKKFTRHVAPNMSDPISPNHDNENRQ